jgi:transcriptional regulator NrdR family protein
MVMGLLIQCPFCQSMETKVLYSRRSKEPGKPPMRRRECLGCGERLTTREIPAWPADDLHVLVYDHEAQRQHVINTHLNAGIMERLYLPFSSFDNAIDCFRIITRRLERMRDGETLPSASESGYPLYTGDFAEVEYPES